MWNFLALFSDKNRIIKEIEWLIKARRRRFLDDQLQAKHKHAVIDLLSFFLLQLGDACSILVAKEQYSAKQAKAAPAESVDVTAIHADFMRLYDNYPIFRSLLHCAQHSESM